MLDGLWQGTLQFGANECINIEGKLEPKNVQEYVLTLCWAHSRRATEDLMS